MYFEADANGHKYQVNVNETRSHWKIALQRDAEDWVYYDISKEDYQYLDDTISFIFKNSSYLIDVIGAGTEYTVYIRGSHRTVKIYNEENLLHESLKTKGSFGCGDSLTAGMPGKIVDVMVEKGDEVEEDQPLLIMEAMKMENEMRASSAVKIKEIYVKPGDSVESGTVLIAFDI